MTDDIICYCFGHTAAAISDEVRRLGHSRIMAEIQTAKKGGACHCQEKNPSGR